jgi:signal transduction histidine kinase
LHEGVLEIVDEGIGMDETEIMRVFERYYRGESDKRGKGIGLTLVKRFCDESGIDIDIISEKERGTTVRLDCRNIGIKR